MEHSNPTECPIAHCELREEGPSAGICDSTSPTPSFTYSMSSAHDAFIDTVSTPIGVYKACYLCRTSGGSSPIAADWVSSEIFTLSMKASSDCSQNRALPKVQPLLANDYSYQIINATIKPPLTWTVSELSGLASCSIIGFAVSSTYIEPVNLEVTASGLTASVDMASGFENTEDSYTFRLLAEYSDFYRIVELSTALYTFTWHRYLCANFPGMTMEWGDYPIGLSDEQWVPANDATTYFHLRTVNVGVPECQRFREVTGSASLEQPSLFNTDQYKVVPSNAVAETVYLFNLVATAEGGAHTITSSQLKLTVGCPSGTLSEGSMRTDFPSEQWVLPNDEDPVVGTYYHLRECVTSIPECPCKMKFSQVSGSYVQDTGLGSWEPSTHPAYYKVAPVNKANRGRYSFIVFLYTEAGSDVLVSPDVRIFHVGCHKHDGGVDAIQVVEGSDQAATQYVEMADPNKLFVLPTFTSTQVECPVRVYKVSTSATSFVASPDLNDPIDNGSGQMIVAPTVSPTSGISYTFYAWVGTSSSELDAYTIAGPYKLFIGCDPAADIQPLVPDSFPVYQLPTASTEFTWPVNSIVSSLPSCPITEIHATSDLSTSPINHHPTLSGNPNTVGGNKVLSSLNLSVFLHEFYLIFRFSDGAYFTYSQKMVLETSTTCSMGETVTVTNAYQYQFGYNTDSIRRASTPTFSVSNGCGIRTFRLTAQPLSYESIPELSQPYSIGMGAYQIKQEAIEDDVLYSFYYELRIEGGLVYYSSIFYLVVGCHAGYSGWDITMGAFPGGLTASQEVAPGSATWFQMPGFTSNQLSCPIVSTTLSASGSSMSAVSDLSIITASSEVKSADTLLDTTYTFYIEVKLRLDVKVRYFGPMTLTVGCPSVVWGPASNPPRTLVISPSASSVVYLFTAPAVTSSIAGCSAVAENEVTAVSVNGSSVASTYLYFDSSCAQPCSEVRSLHSKTKAQLEFTVTSRVTPGVATTSIVSLQIRCDASSTSIFFNSISDVEFVQSTGSGSKASFSTALCSVPSCCESITYYLSTDPAQVVALSQVANPLVEVSSTTVEASVDTSVLFDAEVYLIAENEYGTRGSSNSFHLSTVFDCSKDTISVSKEVPSPQEVQAMGGDGIYLKQSDSTYSAFLALSTSSPSAFALDISGRFSKESPDGQCPIISYSIAQVVSSEGDEIGSAGDLFSISSSGVFQVIDPTAEFKSYSVFISASNAEGSSSSSNLLLLISQTSEQVPLPNVAPSFIEDQSTLEVEVDLRVQELITVSLPAFFDANSDRVSVNWKAGLEEELEAVALNSKLYALEIDSSKLVTDLNFTAELFLDDSRGGRSSRVFQIQVLLKRNELGEILKPNQDPDDGLVGEENTSSAKTEQELELLLAEQSMSVISAKIKKVDYFGKVTIQFNATVAPSAEASNYQTIWVYVVPENQSSPHNTSWQLVELSGKEMVLQINFERPIEVSRLAEQDRLFVNFSAEARSHLYFPLEKSYLSKEYSVLSSKIRKQMPNTVLERTLDTVANTTKTSLLTLLVVTFILNHFLAGGMDYFLLLTRALQIVLHLPLLQIIVPANVSKLFSILIPVATFDVFDPEWTTKLVLDFDEEEQAHLEEQLLDQLEDLGYETHSSLLNLGSLALFTAAYFFQLLGFGLLLGFIKVGMLENLAKVLGWFRSHLFFGDLISLLIDAYFEFLIAGYLQIRGPLSTTAGEVISIGFGILGWILIFGFMSYGFALLLLSPLDKIQLSGVFQDRWSKLHDGVQTKSKWTLAYFPIFALRRVTFFLLAFSITANFQFQALGLIFLNLAVFIYHGQHRPLEGRLKNRIELTNEFLIACITFHLLLFTAWVPEEQLKYQFGWSMVLAVGGLIVFNLYFVLTRGVRHLYLVLVRLWRIVQAKVFRRRSTLSPTAGLLSPAAGEPVESDTESQKASEIFSGQLEATPKVTQEVLAPSESSSVQALPSQEPSPALPSQERKTRGAVAQPPTIFSFQANAADATDAVLEAVERKEQEAKRKAALAKQGLSELEFEFLRSRFAVKTSEPRAQVTATQSTDQDHSPLATKWTYIKKTAAQKAEPDLGEVISTDPLPHGRRKKAKKKRKEPKFVLKAANKRDERQEFCEGPPSQFNSKGHRLKEIVNTNS